MNENYSSGVAFVFEGETEKVFYNVMLRHFNARHPEYSFEEKRDSDTGEKYYVIFSENQRVLIKQNNVGKSFVLGYHII